jgi:hypothetical protein
MTMTTAQAAEKLETTPRELRKFLRSITAKDAQPGKGSRWILEARDVTKMRKQFADWKAAQEAARAAAAEVAETE